MSDEMTAQWAIVELMGHKIVAGKVSKDEMFGKPLVRVDVPATEAFPAFTQFYGPDAIYCVTFVSEAVGQLTAEQSKVNPVSVYIPELAAAEQYKNIIAMLREQIERLQNGLPSPDEGD